MFPEDCTLSVRQHDAGHYTVSAEDPFPVTAGGPTIAAALYAWCQALTTKIEARGSSMRAVRVQFKAGTQR